MSNLSAHWFKTKLWVISNYMTLLLMLLFILAVATLIMTTIAMGKVDSQIREGRENTRHQLERAQQELEILRQEFKETREKGHDERVEIIKYIRCILLLPRTEANRANLAKTLDSCLEGSLKEDVLREQRFLGR